MSSEDLAALIRAGDQRRVLELWEQTHRFIWQQAARRAYTLDGRGGVTAEDLYQSGFLALLSAVDTYDPAAGMTFIGWLAMHLRTAFAEAGGWRTERRRMDPLHRAGSLDAPLSSDMEDLTLADTIADPAAEEAVEAVAERDRLRRLHNALEAAIASLPEEERNVLRARYYHGRTLDEIAMERGIGRERVRQIEAKALRELRRPAVSRALRELRRA